MRLRHWMVGVVLGAVAGGSALVVGVAAVLVQSTRPGVLLYRHPMGFALGAGGRHGR